MVGVVVGVGLMLKLLDIPSQAPGRDQVGRDIRAVNVEKHPGARMEEAKRTRGQGTTTASIELRARE